nr:U-box domain-containing protein 38-like [Ipomoea batatas]
MTRANEEARVSPCSSRLLSALKPLIVSKYAGIQVNAAAALVNISLAKVNKVKIVRAGIVPLLIDVLKGGFEESQEHAAGAIFSLALEDDNKTAIGSNRTKLIKLGAASALLGMMKSGDLAGRVVLVVCNLAVCAEGKTALLDGHAVEVVVEMLRDPELDESTRENCVAALYSPSQGSLRFKGLAKEAKAAEVLKVIMERGSERAKEKAKRLLVALRGRDDDGGRRGCGLGRRVGRWAESDSVPSWEKSA